MDLKDSLSTYMYHLYQTLCGLCPNTTPFSDPCPPSWLGRDVSEIAFYGVEFVFAVVRVKLLSILKVALFSNNAYFACSV